MASCQRYLPVILLLLGLASTGRAIDSPASEPAESAAPARQELEFDRPAGDPSIRQPPGWVDASDRAVTPPFVESDVVVAIDYSTLALLASGLDVDQDGVVGRNRSLVSERNGLLSPARFWTTDPGDTVRALQLRVAQDLVARLAARRNNVGLTSFTLREARQGTSVPRHRDKPEVLVPVGAPAAVLAALADFPPPRERRRSDLGRLLERAAQLLDVAAASNVEARRPREILLLYIGEPSAPDGIYWSSRRALECAADLGERGIAVWGIPIRPGEVGYLDELTRRSGGQVIPLDQLDRRFGAL
jgi:hypothetical protein